MLAAGAAARMLLAARWQLTKVTTSDQNSCLLVYAFMETRMRRLRTSSQDLKS